MAVHFIIADELAFTCIIATERQGYLLLQPDIMLTILILLFFCCPFFSPLAHKLYQTYLLALYSACIASRFVLSSILKWIVLIPHSFCGVNCGIIMMITIFGLVRFIFFPLPCRMRTRMNCLKRPDAHLRIYLCRFNATVPQHCLYLSD